MIIDKGMSKVRFMAFLWPLYGLNMAFICFFLILWLLYGLYGFWTSLRKTHAFVKNLVAKGYIRTCGFAQCQVAACKFSNMIQHYGNEQLLLYMHVNV